MSATFGDYPTGSSDTPSNPSSGDLTIVEIGPEGFALERFSEEGEWERLAVYPDFATVEEIVRIAGKHPDRGLAQDGRTPRQAVPVAPYDLVEMFGRRAPRSADSRPGRRR